ncbi:MAG: hypothetical protein IIC60_10645, partial [Proteobacteria bacterium]|nr:hypothetical protein [Pseudomonadota bacterium]
MQPRRHVAGCIEDGIGGHAGTGRGHRVGVERERLRCAAAGIGGFYTPTSVGTELAEGKEHREINGRIHVLEYPLPGDYGLIRAWKADTAGNLVFRLTQRNFNPLMAMAATVTIVEVEN